MKSKVTYDKCEICSARMINRDGGGTHYSHPKCNSWGVGVCLCLGCAQETERFTKRYAMFVYAAGFRNGRKRAQKRINEK